MPDISSRKIVLAGGGGHAISVADALRSAGKYKEIVITDRDIPAGTLVGGIRVAGDDDMLPDLFADGFTDAFISVGSIKDTALRRSIHEKAASLGFSFPHIADPSAVIAGDVLMDEGVFAGKRAVINAGNRIGKFSIINTAAVIEHECSIGDFSHVSIGAVVCGQSVIENDVFIGANATVIQGIKIGSGCVVGAGAVVLADVPAGTRVIGVWKG